MKNMQTCLGGLALLIASLILSSCNSGINSSASQQTLTVAKTITTKALQTTPQDIKSTSFVAIAKGNGVYVAVGENGNIAYSTNGNSWNIVTIVDGISLHGVTFNSYNNLFYIVGDNGSVYSSANGQNWTVYKNLNPARDLHSVMSVDGNLVIGAESSTIFEVTIKQRGLVTERSTVDNMKLISATYGNGVMVLGSNDGSILYKLASNWSTGTWNRATKFSNTAINGLSFESVDNWYIAATSTGTVASSANGINWSTPVMAKSGDLTSIVLDQYSNNFIVVGLAKSSIIANSSDFNAWSTDEYLPVNVKLNSINCFDKNDCFAVGDNGTILSGVERSTYTQLPIWKIVFGYDIIIVPSGASYSNQNGTKNVVLFDNHVLKFVLQSDANLVCYDDNTDLPLWASKTNVNIQTRPGSMQMLPNGNLYVTGSYEYSSYTNSPGAYIIYRPKDKSINIISADGKTILKELC